MKDVKKYIKAKKRKKKIKKISLITTVIIVALFIFFTKAPIFNIKNVNFQGNVTITEDTLLNVVQDKIGSNIFTANMKEIKNRYLENKYIKSVKVKIKNINTLKVIITEEAPVYYVNDENEYLVINNNLEILEQVSNIDGRRLVEVKGMDLSDINNEEKIDQINSYRSILNKFYPYISQNREAIYLESIDISNIVNIKGVIGDVEIFFGDDSDIHNKMENVYRILLDENIGLVKGYINVGFKGAPVIKKEEVVVSDVNKDKGEE